jgi:predicted RNase H-like HicB family nuclease
VQLLPGCVATGSTPKEVNQRIKEAVELHVKSSIEDGDDIAAIFHGDYELVYWVGNLNTATATKTCY